MYYRSIFKHLVLALGVCTCIAVSAKDYNLIDWSESTPPPQDIIFDIRKGADNYLWLATINGLYYFNGDEYFKFEFGKNSTTNDEYFLDLERDQVGNIWALTREFLVRIDGEQNFTKYATPGGRQPNRTPGQLVMDGEHNLWFTANNKIYLIENGHFNEIFASPTENIKKLFPAFEAGCWFSTESEALKVGLAGFIENSIPYVKQPSDSAISAIHELRPGELAVAGFELLQIYSDRELVSSVPVENFGRIDDIALLGEEINIVGEKGLARLIGGRAVNYSSLDTNRSLERLHFIYKEGDNYWLSGWRSGLFQLKRNFARPQKLSPKDVISAIKISSDSFLYATFYGLKIAIDGDYLPQENHPQSIQQQIRGMAYNPETNESIIAPTTGLFYIKNIFHPEFLAIDFYRNKTVNEIVLLQETEYLVATSSGVFIFDASTQESLEVRPKNDPSPRLAHYMFPLSKTKWVVLFDSGFAYYQHGAIGERYAKTYLDEKGHKQPQPFRFGTHDPQRNAFWLITDQPDRQVSYWKNGVNTSVKLAKDPVRQNDTYYTLLVDDYDNLWVSHEYGLFRAKLPRQLPFQFDSPLPIELLDVNPNGMDECNTGSPLKDGTTISFPCQNGVIEIESANFNHALNSPSTHLISASRSEQAIALDDLLEGGLTFNADARSFLFRYTAHYLEGNNRINLRGRILGFTETWQQLPQNTLAISHLPPGGYQLEVQSRSNLGPWSTSHFTPLKIEAFFYQTPWFLLTTLIATIFLISLLVRIRTQFLTSNQIRLEKLVSEKTISLKAANQKLKLLHNSDQRDNYALQVAVAEKTLAQEEELEVRVQLEKELYDAHRMELLGQLSSGVSHDFNNMLSVILLSTESIHENLDELSPENLDIQHAKITKRIGTIQNAIQQSKAVIAQLKSFNKKNQPLERLNLNKEVADAFSLAATTISRKVSVTTKITETKVDSFIDSSRLLQILLNLVVNARDACSEGSTITLSLRETASASSLRCLTCGAVIPSNSHEIEVLDTGGGITIDNLSKMFNPFFTTKESNGGSGIGLRVVTNNVHDANGHVFVESELGSWTKVRIFLPPADNLHRKKANIPVTSYTARTKKKRILVVEDQLPVAEVLLELIEAHGFVGEHVDTAEAALDLLDKTSKYSLVIADHFLGGMTGKELLKRLRRKHPNLPLTLMTAYQQITLPVEELNTLEILRKPFSMADVGSLLKQVN